MTTAPPTSDWQALAAAKRQSNAEKIPKEWLLPSALTDTFTATSTQNVLGIPRSSGILTEKELELTENYDATALVELMVSGKVKSVEVTTAFCKRAAIAQQCVNCLTETMFDDALVRAKECDDYLEKEGKPLGPFHGLPISVKDSFNVKGSHSTIGYIAYLSNPPAASNSTLISILFQAGAVFYCKTNLPQTMMTADSDNNIFGRTLNPHNLSLTAGGSTGGEGALIAMRGSPLGLATDIAGSNRIPALCDGISSIKPTALRIPFGGGVPPGRLGSPSSITAVIGPSGHSVRDYELFMRTVLDSEPWDYDENVIAVPWRRVQPSTTPLRFGLIRGHPKRPLHPPVARTLHTAATKLKEAGHSIVLLDDKIPDLWDSSILAFKFFMLDPKKTPFQIVNAGGEPWVPSIATAQFAELKQYEASLDDLFDMNVARAKILKAYHDLFVQEKLDAVIMPGYQAVAPKHDTFGVPIYTVVQNLLNYPSGILPFLKAEWKLDEPFFKPDTAYEPAYEPEAIEGAPGSIQVMGKPMKDEELVEIMKVVEGILGKDSS